MRDHGDESVDGSPVREGGAPARDVVALRVLGTSGGIGGGRRTASYLVGEDVLLEAGTGVADLGLRAIARVDHVLVTHAHMDHVAALPLLLDTVAGRRDRSVTVHATRPVLDVLRAHLFNNHLWPDFSTIPLASGEPVLRYAELAVGAPTRLGAARFTAIPANHGVPSVGYLIEGPRGSLLFSGDTAGNRELWETVGAHPELDRLLVEVSFPDRLASLARVSGHLHPALLAEQLRAVQSPPPVYVVHMKPGHEAAIRRELRAHGLDSVQFLARSQTIEL